MSSLKVIKSISVTDAILTATDVPENDHAAWSSGTTYAAGNRVIVTAEHKIYESLQAANLNHPPALSPTCWAEVSLTNRWKLFDLSATIQTAIGASAYYELTPSQAVNAVALINIAGILSVRIRLSDPFFGVVYDKTADICGVSQEATWYSWFFDPRTERTGFVALDLPTYPTAVLRVDMTTGGSGTIGALVFGSQRVLGKGVTSGARLGIQDYSRKERNDFGDTVLVRRAFARRISLDFMVMNEDLDRIYSLLADLRATPCVWVGDDLYASLVVFGFYNNFEITIPYVSHSDCSIDIEGLT